MSADTTEIWQALLDIERPVALDPARPVPTLSTRPNPVLLPAIPASSLGNRDFLADFKLRLACTAGSMANGISSVDLVAAMAENGCLASFGAAGLSVEEIGKALAQLQQRLGDQTYAMNLIHSPGDGELEWETARLYVERGLAVVEASAFLRLTPAVALCRARGLKLAPNGDVLLPRRIIAKVSRREVAEQFLRPVASGLLDQLVAEGSISRDEAELASTVPVCDALTVEADSGGHTDRQPLVTLFPAIRSLRDELLHSGELQRQVYIGTAGGMGTPESIAAAFAMGADYVTTGSINQACVEAGTSVEVKQMLALAKTSDVSMAPAADMFALGAQVQVLKQGSLFPMRAQKLYELYRSHHSLDDLPAEEIKRLEEQILRMPVEEAKRAAVDYTRRHHPEALESLTQKPREMMLRVFLWYMAQSSLWATKGDSDRKIDYQIWCGPAMGAFNAWTAGSRLANPAERKVFAVTQALMQGAAYLLRLAHLRTLGYTLEPSLGQYFPNDREDLKAAPTVVQAPSPRPSERKITGVITEAIAEQTGTPREAIDITLSFTDFEMDSLKAVIVLNRIEKFLDRELSPTLVWNYPTIQQLARHLALEDCSQ